MDLKISEQDRGGLKLKATSSVLRISLVSEKQEHTDTYALGRKPVPQRLLSRAM